MAIWLKFYMMIDIIDILGVISLSEKTRIECEFRHRVNQVWASFHKYEKVLLNKHVSLQKRLQYFEMCVNPSVLFGLCTFPLSVARLQVLDRLQRRMLRRIVGWRRIDTEPWSCTMRRMNERLDMGHRLYPLKSWTECYARALWRYVLHIIHGPISLWSRILCKFNWQATPDPSSRIRPRRSVGRPRLRWDDIVHSFCSFIWPGYAGAHWFDILVRHLDEDYEEVFVTFVSAALV